MQGIHLLRTNRNYRNFWLASVGSQLGDWFNEVALAQVTLALTNSPTAAVGVVIGATSLLCGVSWLVQFGRRGGELPHKIQSVS